MGVGVRVRVRVRVLVLFYQISLGKYHLTVVVSVQKATVLWANPP